MASANQSGAPSVSNPPADERFLYFAYGSNMLMRRLRAPKRAPSARMIGRGFVAGRRLSFDKSSKKESGKCDIGGPAAPTDRVYGVLFSIEKIHEEPLDEAEGATGANPGYSKTNVQVVMDDGSTQTAMTYIATKQEPGLRPYHWYKALVVAGAVEHKLPPAYIEWLRTFESQPDADVERRVENEAILFEN